MKVVFDVADDAYLDVERELIAAMARDWGMTTTGRAGATTAATVPAASSDRARILLDFFASLLVGLGAGFVMMGLIAAIASR